MHIIQNIQFKTIKKDPFVTQINRKSKVAFFLHILVRFHFSRFTQKLKFGNNYKLFSFFPLFESPDVSSLVEFGTSLNTLF